MNRKRNKLKEKKWLLKQVGTPEINEAVRNISSSLGINPIIASLLYGRGYTNAESAKQFLYMESEVLSDPMKMADMKLAVDRIRMALDRGEKITVYGDYDVDGVTSVCTLYLYLKSRGADVDS